MLLDIISNVVFIEVTDNYHVSLIVKVQNIKHGNKNDNKNRNR